MGKAGSLLAALWLLLGASCGGSDPGTGPGGVVLKVAQVQVEPATAAVLVGDARTLNARAFAANGTELTGRTIQWASDNVGIATVTSSGLVTGVGVGQATIAATSGGVSGFATVNVGSLTLGLVAHYPMDGTGNDVSGNGFHGTVLGGIPTTDRHGVMGKAMKFSGDNGFIEALDQSKLRSPSVTVSCWVRLDDYPAVGDGFSLVDRMDAYPPPSGYRLAFRGTGAFEAAIGTSGGMSSTIAPGPEVGRWTHVAMTFEGTSLRLFVDGRQVAEVSSGHPISYGTAVNLGLGGRTTGKVSVMKGGLDEVRIYSRALTASEVSFLATP